jgi:MFS family permease
MTTNFKLLTEYKDYRNFWFSNFVSALAVWIQTVGAGIYMSELSSSPLVIAMVQCMATLPIFLVSIPFGVLADLINPYRMMLQVQLLMTAGAFLFAMLALLHAINPSGILVFIFLLGLASAIRLPTGQSAISQTIPHSHIKAAAILNNFGFNIARCCGPFIAGFTFYYLGAGQTFLLAFLLFALSSMYFWQKSRNSPLLLSNAVSWSIYKEKLISGLKTARNSSEFIHIAKHAFLFFALTTSIWSILPYYARYFLDMTAKGQGYLTAMIGLGALLTGFLLPILRHHCSNRMIIWLVFICAGISICLMTVSKNHFLIYGLMFLFGFSWASAVAFFNGEIQASAVSEFRGRLISIYFVIMYAALALGSYLVGKLLTLLSIQTTLTAIGALLCLLSFILVIKKT